MEIQSLWPFATFLVIYTSFLLGCMAWMLHAQISPIKELLVKNEQATQRIDHKLGNHITETNRKIEVLSGRIDKLADRFDSLNQVLLENKQGQ